MTQPDVSAFSKEMREKLERVDFGLEVQAFLRTKVGVYLVERASADVAEHTQALKSMDILKDPVAATRVQMQIATAENVLYWLGDAVREGTQLMEQMMAEERQALGNGSGDGHGGDPTGN